MDDIRVERLSYDRPILVGCIADNARTFSYDASYLDNPTAIPLSLSLPLQAEPFYQESFRPYFEGLLAEGTPRQALAAELQIREDDYLSLLVRCGRECIGDVLISDDNDAAAQKDFGYEPISHGDLIAMFRDLPESAAENAASRLSLAGTQNKVGLARMPAHGPSGWMRPKGLAATTHILKTSTLRDLPEVEYLCMQAARACGITVPNCELLELGRPVLAVERFDRFITTASGAMRVERVHQEDLAQAFGITPGSKYAELPGGSVAAIAELIRRNSTQPAADLSQFAATLLLSYVIGNCDGHLKNHSIRLNPFRGHRTTFSLAPAYDLVSTTYFPKISKSMAMRLGGARNIDEVTPRTFVDLAKELGITTAALRRLGKRIAERVRPAIVHAGDGDLGTVLTSTPYVAEGLMEDIAPRLRVLDEFAQS